jgi:hypothetical protein
VPSKVTKSLQIKFASVAHLAEVHFLKDRLKSKISEVPSGNPKPYYVYGRWEEFKISKK